MATPPRATSAVAAVSFMVVVSWVGGGLDGAILGLPGGLIRPWSVEE